MAKRKLKQGDVFDLEDWVCQREKSGSGEDMLFCSHKKKEAIISLFPRNIRISANKSSKEIKL